MSGELSDDSNDATASKTPADVVYTTPSHKPLFDDEPNISLSRVKVDHLNARAEKVGRRDMCVGYDSPLEAIERAEQIVFSEEVSRGVPHGTPDRNRVIQDHILSAAIDKRGPARLKDVVAAARAKLSEAAGLENEAQRELAKARAVQEQLDNARHLVEDEKARLERVYQVQAMMSEAIAELDTDDAVVNRIANSHGTQSFTPSQFAEHVDFGRILLRAGLDDCLRAEAVIKGRIAALSEEVAKLEQASF